MLIEQIHFQEAGEALSLFIYPYIGRTNSFPGGSPEAEKGWKGIRRLNKLSIWPPIYPNSLLQLCEFIMIPHTISIYPGLEGLGFRVWGLGFRV